MRGEQRYQPDGHTIGTEEEAPSTETPGVSLLALVSEVDVHRAQQIADELPILFRYEHALRLEIEKVRQTIGPVFAQPPMPGKEPRALVFVIGGCRTASRSGLRYGRMETPSGRKASFSRPSDMDRCQVPLTSCPWAYAADPRLRPWC